MKLKLTIQIHLRLENCKIKFGFLISPNHVFLLFLNQTLRSNLTISTPFLCVTPTIKLIGYGLNNYDKYIVHGNK